MKKLLIFALAVAASLWAADALNIRIGAPIQMNVAATPANNTFVLNQATDKVWVIFQATNADPIATFLIPYGVRAGTPVQQRVSIQGVSATTGNPDGVAAATAAFTPPADTTWDNTTQAVSMSHDGSGGVLTSYTPVAGTFYAISIEPCQNATAPCSGAATPDGSNSSSFRTSATQIGALSRASVPYAGTNDNGTNAHLTDTPIWGYRSATKTYGLPIQGSTPTTVNTISVNDEQGVEFSVSSSYWSTYQVRGIRFVGTAPATGKSVKVNLYTGTTVLQSVTWDTDIIRGTGTTNSVHELYFSDVSLQTLSTGTTYRVGVCPQSATTALGVAFFTFAAAGDRAALPWGTMFNYTTRTGCGGPCDGGATAWTSTTTSRPMIELILADITAPASGGGGQKGYSFVQ